MIEERAAGGLYSSREMERPGSRLNGAGPAKHPAGRARPHDIRLGGRRHDRV